MHCMLMDLLHGFEVLSTTEETLFNTTVCLFAKTYSDLSQTPATASPNPWGLVEPSLRTTALMYI